LTVQLFEVRFKFDLHLLNNPRTENSSAATTGRPGPAPLTRGVTPTVTGGLDHFRSKRGVSPTTVGKTRDLQKLIMSQLRIMLITDHDVSVTIEKSAPCLRITISMDPRLRSRGSAGRGIPARSATTTRGGQNRRIALMRTLRHTCCLCCKKCRTTRRCESRGDTPQTETTADNL